MKAFLKRSYAVLEYAVLEKKIDKPNRDVEDYSGYLSAYFTFINLSRNYSVIYI